MNNHSKAIAVLCIAGAMLCSCNIYDREIEYENGLLTDLVEGHIVPVKQQVTAIEDFTVKAQASASAYRTFMAESAAQADAIEGALDDLQQGIEDTRADLSGHLTADMDEVLEQISAAGESSRGQIDALRADIDTLEDAAAAMETRVATLQSYADSLKAADEDWMSATFTTKAQYEATCKDLAALKVHAESVNARVASLDRYVSEYVDSTIQAGVSALGDTLAVRVQSLEKNLDAAVNAAHFSVVDAYSKAFKDAFEQSESSLQGWVSDTLKYYYKTVETQERINHVADSLTAAVDTMKSVRERKLRQLEEQYLQDTEVEDRLDSLEKVLSSTIETAEQDLATVRSLSADLDAQRVNLSEAYSKAITEAFDGLDGKFTDEIIAMIDSANAAVSAKISEVTERLESLDSRAESLNTRIASVNVQLNEKLLSYLTSSEEYLAKLIRRVNSARAVPDWSDGSVSISDTYEERANQFIWFEIRPASVAKELVAMMESGDAEPFSIKASRQKKEDIPMPVISASFDEATSLVCLEVSTENLDKGFYTGSLKVMARLLITDGDVDMEVTSPYFGLTPVKQ